LDFDWCEWQVVDLLEHFLDLNTHDFGQAELAQCDMLIAKDLFNISDAQNGQNVLDQ
jgi:hypothetical protein